MALKVGIIGLPNVGKSTLFNALCLTSVEAANYPFATIEPNTGVVLVPDERLRVLSDLFQPKRTVPATVEFIDIAGLVRGASHGEGLGNRFLAHIRECQALIEVVRAFKDPSIINVEEGVDPRRDIETIAIELCLADLLTIEKRLSVIETKARMSTDKALKAELELLGRLKTALEAGKPVRLLSLKEEEKTFIDVNYHLLTLKPLIYVANIDLDAVIDPTSDHDYQVIQKIAKDEGVLALPVSCPLEKELAPLTKKERQEFLLDLGLQKTGLSDLIRAAYHLLDLKTFFTVGSDECRAWTFRNGLSAPQCAGIVHSDMERGFIKAEIYHYDDLLHYGTEAALKEAGRLRSEGKGYLMNDGDIAFFRFNV